MKTHIKFTLIELLVVIAIIAILASMLLPAIQNAKALSKSSVCVGNIKQLGYGTQMYMEDYGGYIPFPSAVTNELDYESWWNLVGEEEFDLYNGAATGAPRMASGYIKWRNKNLDGYSDSFKCPASDQISPKWLTFSGDKFNAHYSMNNKLQGPNVLPYLGNLYRLQQFPKPEDTLFIGDGNLQPNSNGFYFTSGMSGYNNSGWSVNDYPYLPYIWNYPQFKCHNMSVNISFMDLHIEQFKRVPFKRWVNGNGQWNDQWRLNWTLAGTGMAY